MKTFCLSLLSATLALPAAAQSGTTKSGVQYSTADMSQFTANRPLGVMLL